MKAFALLLVLCVGAKAETITRATTGLSGVTSPRGFFNITVRLYQIQGVQWAKYDLVKSRITLDFAPGVSVTEAELRQAVNSAGYKASDVRLETVETPQPHEHRLGWTKIRHPKSRNSVARWFELNF